MNIEINGRHALLFDDDTAAAFVNSDDALVEWNSLLIDRYDVRHLLSSPPPSRRRRNPQTSHSSSADADLDYERYLDLPSPSEEEEEEEEAKPEPTAGFNAVPFSYGNDEDPNDQKTAETEPEVPKFHPPFLVPDSLVQNLPSTEKVHQIIARTALFVSKNGGQSEIILRVKQGDNPTFGFLMPDHHLHPYFRYLVDNQDLLHSKDNGQPENENISNTGALSLLGSVYGTGEDDDGGTDHQSSSSKECVSGNTVNADATLPLAAGKPMLPSDKDEPVIKKNSLSNALKERRTSSAKKDEFLGSLSSVPDKSRASSLPPIPKTELMLVDPPSEMKRLVEKIVEFIIKNGRQFETVLMEQDRGHGRFPFLIPSNIFHPYYLKVLQRTQESKLTVKSYNEKEDFRGHISNKKKSISRENENDIMESDDIPLDSERKEKFKMVINKSKKEGSDVPAKSTQSPPRVQVDADQAAAILQAATRGIKPSNLGFLYGQSSNEDGSSESQLTHEQKLKAERLKRAKMFVAQLKSGAAPLKAGLSRGSSAEPQTDNRLAAKETEKNTPPSDVGTSDNISKSEKEHLNEEKRAMRKYRARSTKDNKDDHDDDNDDDEKERKRSHRHHSKKHRSRNHSVEDDERDEKYADERDYKHAKGHRSHRSSHKHDDDMDRITDEKDQKHSKKKKHRSSSSYEDGEQESEHERSRRKHRSHEDEQESEHERSRKKHRYEDEQESEDEYSRKKHRSYEDEQESEHERSRKKHRYEDEDSEHESSRKKHRSHHSSHDEDDSDDKHSRRKQKHRSHRSSHRHKHRKSHSSRHKEKHDEFSEEESRDQNKADKNVKGPNSEREELEEGEITGPSKGVPLVNGAAREPSVDASSSLQDPKPLTQPSTTTEVSDDLRAKIRAMLMSTT